MKNPAVLVSPDEYLNTSYKPDMDYVDGVLVRRKVGTQLNGCELTMAFFPTINRAVFS